MKKTYRIVFIGKQGEVFEFKYIGEFKTEAIAYGRKLKLRPEIRKTVPKMLVKHIKTNEDVTK
jgi:hypothetical protein